MNKNTTSHTTLVEAANDFFKMGTKTEDQTPQVNNDRLTAGQALGFDMNPPKTVAQVRAERQQDAADMNAHLDAAMRPESTPDAPRKSKLGRRVLAGAGVVVAAGGFVGLNALPGDHSDSGVPSPTANQQTVTSEANDLTNSVPENPAHMVIEVQPTDQQ